MRWHFHAITLLFHIVLPYGVPQNVDNQVRFAVVENEVTADEPILQSFRQFRQVQKQTRRHGRHRCMGRIFAVHHQVDFRCGFRILRVSFSQDETACRVSPARRERLVNHRNKTLRSCRCEYVSFRCILSRSANAVCQSLFMSNDCCRIRLFFLVDWRCLVFDLLVQIPILLHAIVEVLDGRVIWTTLRVSRNGHQNRDKRHACSRHNKLPSGPGDTTDRESVSGGTQVEVSPGDFPPPDRGPVDAATTIPNKIVRPSAKDESALSVPTEKTLCGRSQATTAVWQIPRELVYGREILMRERRSSGGPVSCGVGLRSYIVEQLYSNAQRVIRRIGRIAIMQVPTTPTTNEWMSGS